MTTFGKSIAIPAILFLLASCNQESGRGAASRPIENSAPEQATSESELKQRELVVPSDAKAVYTILEIDGEWPNKTIVTRRVGPSGTSFSNRLYNCSKNQVKYIGSGDSLEEMNASKPDPNMGEIVSGSIADYVGRVACQR